MCLFYSISVTLFPPSPSRPARPPPPSSSSSRRRAFSCCRRRRAAHPQHDCACWPPRPTSGGSVSLNPVARQPPRLRPQAHEHAGLLCCTAQRCLQTPRSSAFCTSLRWQKFGPLRRAPSAVCEYLLERQKGGLSIPRESGAARVLLSHAAVLQR